MKKINTLLAIFLTLSLSLCTQKRGKVVTETMTSGGYTYMLINDSGQKYWIATSTMQISVGDMVHFQKDQEMKNFESKSLNKTFDSIYFVPQVVVLSSSSNTGAPIDPTIPKGPAGMPGMNPSDMNQGHTGAVKTDQKDIKPGSIKLPGGGHRVADIYAKRKTLNGQATKVRGIVTKFSANIMGKNWIHIQDGTGKENNTHDLTVTTADQAQKGDTVLIQGKVVSEKDFGSGYKYPVIIEDAKITVEK